jgi:bacillithiol system protein YtxJ
MSILKAIGNMFNTSMGSNGDFDWQGISSEEEVSNVLLASNDKPQVIYKHSPSCAISYLALRDLETLPNEVQTKADYYMVDVVGQRPISNFITKTLAIRHESPQLFIIKDGEVVWNGSHHQVKADAVSELL